MYIKYRVNFLDRLGKGAIVVALTKAVIGSDFRTVMSLGTTALK